MPRGRPKKTIQKIEKAPSYMDKVSEEIASNQSKLSMVLGGLIVLVIGILIFNYFNKSKPSLGPAQQSEQTEQKQDVTPDNLPGKYTVKEDDTLFTIAENYYKDGSRFEEIAKANNLNDSNSIVVGQVLEIPKIELQSPSPTPSESPQASPSEAPTETPTDTPTPTSSPTTSSPQNDSSSLGTGGGNTTIWGTKIDTDTYTVQEGDWLSTIAGRAYGDIFSYKKLAEVNNIPNPDYIVPGQVLKIPR